MNALHPIAAEMFAAARSSVYATRRKISKVRIAPYAGKPTVEQIIFEFDGKTLLGTLRGRNRDLCIGFGEEQDKAIALRVLLDGDVVEITP